MKISYAKDTIADPLTIMRRAGYQHFVDPVTKKPSFTLKLTAGFYPRFHVYVKERDDAVIFDLHLDQKKPSYAGTSAHGGEYDGPTVEKEMQRIAGWVEASRVKPTQATAPTPHHDSSQAALQDPPASTEHFGGIFGG